ncbi:MAG TPA: hypothetical protein DDW94_06150 [Deltaproteobacteria bacterium]|nr:MAG: hypothetical protein A2Z79_00680 [Deltaproteobacteria bacterium GWA2_55_82]OGQ64892.1 MAG: hypothetical protein A3I81_04790 [Deltaproteobacteria bacterium RIFCSPLOWO2_02_FULL_55_12]OIJ73960.1 MAG: hypothetical protein A2V21_306585 [Deltaproteobacteria bacterium GWC2_55_46]HBG46558.1 hypothetical protein [Deltaproteobacteria bacterium]HCY09960.1 hypothetical protein [Deltaproteobacteria bacterium]
MECGCVYLTESVCKASVSSMVPSLFDYEAYCHSEGHYHCPVLLAHTLRDGYKELLRAAV